MLLFVLSFVLPYIEYLVAPGFYTWKAFGGREYGLAYFVFGMVFNSALYTVIVFYWSKKDFAPDEPED